MPKTQDWEPETVMCQQNPRRSACRQSTKLETINATAGRYTQTRIGAVFNFCMRMEIMRQRKANLPPEHDGGDMPLADSPERKARHDLKNRLGVVLGNISLLKASVQRSGSDNDRRALALLEKNANEMRTLIDEAYADKLADKMIGLSATIKQAKILVVDDEQDFVDTTKRMLENEGYSVGCANSGAQGLKCVKDYNLMLLDLRMPKMSGYEVLKKMKKAGIRVPVIVMTGLEVPETMREEIACTYPGTAVIFKSELGRLPSEIKSTLKRCMKSAKIMVVDDNKDYSQTIAAMLGGRGYATVTADSPEDCLMKAEEEKPDLILLDIMMPRSSMTARDVVDRLRMMKGLEKTPVIYLSGVQASDKQKKELVGSGYVSGFLEKPVSESDLFRSMGEALERRKSGK